MWEQFPNLIFRLSIVQNCSLFIKFRRGVLKTFKIQLIYSTNHCIAENKDIEIYRDISHEINYRFTPTK